MRLWLSAWALDTGLENFLSHVELSQDISDSDFPGCLKMLHSPAHACLQNSHSYFCHLPPSRYLECLACKSHIGPITSPAWDGGDLFLPWLSAHPTTVTGLSRSHPVCGEFRYSVCCGDSDTPSKDGRAGVGYPVLFFIPETQIQPHQSPFGHLPS